MLSPLERDLLEADELRTRLEAFAAKIRARAAELRTAADSCERDSGPLAASLAKVFREIATALERDAERLGKPP